MADYPIDTALHHLNNSGIVRTNNALYQTIKELINAARSTQVVVNTIVNPTGGSSPTPAFAGINNTYLTATNQVPLLPYSVQLLAGTGITFDDSVINQRTINSAGGVHQFFGTVNNTNFKSLPTTFIELVTAPGAGKTIVPLWAMIYVDSTAGAYTNVDAGSQAGLTIAYGDWDVDCFNFMPFDGASRRMGLQPINAVPDAAALFAAYPDQTNLFLEENKPLKLVAWNDSGDYTGGNAANVTYVAVSYVILNYTTGVLS
mgnify:CR=1 FL=1